MNNSKVLIERLERLSNKKIILLNEDTVFKPLRINERIESKRKELVDKGIITIDNSTKTLTYKGDLEHTEYLVLCTFYKDYTTNVKGHVFLYNCDLSSIDVRFKEVDGSFDISSNNLISLKNCPESIDFNFYCNDNKLNSLEGCPKTVGMYFVCTSNSKQFLEEEIEKICKVGQEIHI
jgi:hypothetical protein